MATTLGNGNITFGDGTTLSTASMINSIQRGTVTAGANGSAASGVVNISAVVTGKSMVIVQGTGLGNSYFGSGEVHFTTFNSTTQFGWLANAYNATYTTASFSWQVIEFK